MPELKSRISKDKINRLILNHLIQEGYENAAKSFSKEASIDIFPEQEPRITPQENPLNNLLGKASKSREEFLEAAKQFNDSPKLPDYTIHKEATARGFSLISKRREIKLLILKGDIQKAIEVISIYYPTILDSNNLLLFKLLRLNLIEMIRRHKLLVVEDLDNAAENEKAFLDEVLGFVRKNLVNKVTQSFELLRELEIAMSLLCFTFDPTKPISELSDLPEELKQLFDLSLRNDCYRIVNRVIIELENSDVDTHQYKHQHYHEFDVHRLQKLQILNKEDVEMVDADTEASPRSGSPADINLESILPPPQTTKENVFKNTMSSTDVPTSLDSKLETIAKVWTTTERKVAEKKVKVDRVEFNDTNKIWL